MKVVIAIDSFKGSLSSMQAADAAREGILRAHPDARVSVYPLSDGGEGTTDTLIDGLGGRRVEIQVCGPDGSPVAAHYGILPQSGGAVMEMAQAAGLTLSRKRDPLQATTRGVGEMIRDALSRGVRRFLIGIGGSATNDGGIGMLQALGWRFLTADGSDAGEGAQALAKIDAILPPGSEMQALLSESTFRIACDVTNPLCGANGATYVFGPQKGLAPNLLEPIDAGMAHYADAAEKATGRICRQIPGTGAAGGLGFALCGFLNASLTPGVDLILDAVGLEKELPDADFLVTGEGRLDAQTAMGKAPVGAARLAKKYGVRTIAFAGSVTPEASALHQAGIDAYFPILRSVCTPEEAMKPENAFANLRDTAEQVFRLL